MLQVLEGYGQTENSAGATLTWLKDTSIGEICCDRPPKREIPNLASNCNTKKETDVCKIRKTTEKATG